MPSLWDKVEQQLSFVASPSQYIGDEWNSIRKDDAVIRFGFVFPDAYAIGMSHLGLHIIYGMLNAKHGVACERIFAPMPDMEARMRANDIPLFSLETHRPAKDFNALGFSLQSEMQYTNIFHILDLARIPILAAERELGKHPLIIGGGPCAFYPEPVADVFDLFILGDGEEAVDRLVDVMHGFSGDKADLLKTIAREVPGAYVPSHYRPEYAADGTIASIAPLNGALARIDRALIPSMEEAYYPVKPIVPWTEVVHDRINLEIMRGCPHRCRFCQAVNIKNKLRFREVDTLLDLAEQIYTNTGYDEIALTSLSSGDYPHISELMARLNARYKARRVGVTLPSLRIDEKLKEIPAMLKSVRKSGFTIAPEAGTEALRIIIKKSIRDVDLYDTARAAFKEGWRHIKLYFIIGLPFETDEDIRGIVETARAVSMLRKDVDGKKGDVNVSISPFVPKPHTAYQWSAVQPLEVVEDKIRLLDRLSRNSRVHLKINDPKKSYIEAVLARGDRRLLPSILHAWRQGARFDEWGEYFSYDRWIAAFKESGIDPDFHARRERSFEEVLPWDHLSSSVPKEFLIGDIKRCRAAVEARAAAQKTASLQLASA